MTKCPVCGGSIQDKAIRCENCTESVNESGAAAPVRHAQLMSGKVPSGLFASFCAGFRDEPDPVFGGTCSCGAEIEFLSWTGAELAKTTGAAVRRGDTRELLGKMFVLVLDPKTLGGEARKCPECGRFVSICPKCYAINEIGPDDGQYITCRGCQVRLG